MSTGESFGLKVECYAGYRGEEMPRRFYLGKRKIEALEIIDRWISPDFRYFKIRGDDGGTYIIRQDLSSQGWELRVFDGGNSPSSI